MLNTDRPTNGPIVIREFRTRAGRTVQLTRDDPERGVTFSQFTIWDIAPDGLPEARIRFGNDFIGARSEYERCFESAAKRANCTGANRTGGAS